jgi:glycerophosphoryl diester phosphodiesterase
MFPTRIAALLLALLACRAPAAAADPAPPKPRLLVLTDIGGDPDDRQSMIRLMLYANEFEVEGLVATAAGVPGELKQAVTKPELIREIVNAYAKVRPNLLHHRPGYPDAKYLLDRVKSGNPNRGLKFVGEGHDTDGSRHIIAVVDRNDPRPVNVTIWGGQTDFAQALWRVRKDRTPEQLEKFLGRIRVYDINDQDRIAVWINENFPGLFYVLASCPPGADKREGAYRGMYLGGDESLTSREWVDTHVRKNHGPLGALYPTNTWTAPNPHSCLKEGDTPSWFYFLPTGLGDPAHPDWGCWGGRFLREKGKLFRDAKDTVGKTTHARATVWRWRPEFQADFAARMAWCVEPVKNANHPPAVVLNKDTTRGVLELQAKAGEVVNLSAVGSTDPDGDRLAFRWFVYPEAGSYGKDVPIREAESEAASLAVPSDAAGKSIHVVLAATDRGTPPLARYRRLVLHVAPDPLRSAGVAKAAADVKEVIGHMGSCADTPGNTLAGIRRAIEAGAHVAEVDVRTTKDGALVCMHDDTVDRTTDGKGKVAALTLAEVKKLDAGVKFDAKFEGEPVPTLREVLAAAKGKIGVMLDLKEPGEEYVRKIAAEVRQHGEPKRLVIGIRGVEQAKLFAKLLPEARQIGLVPTQDDIELFAEAGVKVIRLWPRWLTDSTLVPRVRKAGAELHVGTGNGTPEEVLPLLLHRPESLSSDDPAKLRKTLAELARP